MKPFLISVLRIVGLYVVLSAFGTLVTMDTISKGPEVNAVVALALIIIAALSALIVTYGAILALYFLPWMFARERHHRHELAIFLLTLFLGWTVIGWVIALMWAHMDDGRLAKTGPIEFARMAA